MEAWAGFGISILVALIGASASWRALAINRRERKQERQQRAAELANTQTETITATALSLVEPLREELEQVRIDLAEAQTEILKLKARNAAEEAEYRSALEIKDLEMARLGARLESYRRRLRALERIVEERGIVLPASLPEVE